MILKSVFQTLYNAILGVFFQPFLNPVACGNPIAPVMRYQSQQVGAVTFAEKKN